MVVFMEYVLIDNFFIDYLLLKTTFFIMNILPKKSRLIISSLIGAGFSLLFPMITITNVINLLLKFLVGALMVLLCYKFTSFRCYCISLTVFLTLTFLTGGAIIGIFNLLGINYSSTLSIAVMLAPVCIILKTVTSVIKYVYTKRHVTCLTYQVEITALNNVVTALGFLDTGNFLYDGFNPVIVITKRVFVRLIKDGNFLGLRKQKITTVNGEQEKISFNCNKLVIKGGGQENIFNNVTVTVTENINIDGVDVLLHPALMEKENAKIYKTKTS